MSCQPTSDTLPLMQPIDRARLHSLMQREQKKFVEERPKSKALFERALLSLLLAGCATGQVAPQQPKLSILLPVNTLSDKFEVRYVLYGSFGANGRYISPNPDSTGVVTIPLSVEGKMATAIKLFAWTPGCQFATYDLTVH